MASPTRKEELKVELANARDRLTGHGLGLRRSLSVVEVMKRGVRQKPVVWFGGAILLGLLFSRLPARKKQVKVNVKAPKLKLKGDSPAEGAGKAAFAVTALKFGLDLLKPHLMRWVREQKFFQQQRQQQTPPPASEPLRPAGT